MSDSFATAPRLDSTTLTLRIYPKPPTDRPPTVLSPAPSTPLPFSPPSLSPPYCRYLLARSHPTSTNHLRILRLPACLPACGACFPIPHSILVVVARTPREKVTSQSRVSQDPANPSWYKIAPSGSQQHRCHHRRCRSPRNAPGQSNIEKLGFRAEAMRYRRQREMPMV